jgi:hypothetical protein
MNMKKRYKFDKEKDMYGYFERLFFKKYKFFYYKLTDASQWTKPYDAIMGNHLWTRHIEYKILDNITDDVYKSLRPTQRYALDQLHNFWQNAVVIVYYRDIDDIVVYRYNNRKIKLILDTITGKGLYLDD